MTTDAILMMSAVAHEITEFADAYSTNIALTCGKLNFKEGNPISAWIISKIGVTPLWIFKMVVPIAITVEGVLANTEKAALIVNLSLAAVSGVVATLNIIKLKKAGIPVGLI